MKKFHALLFLVFFLPMLHAQEDEIKTVLHQPLKRNWQIELNFMPWNTASNNVGIDQLTVKYRVGDRISLRMGLQYNGNKQSKDFEKIDNPRYYDISEYEMQQSLFGIMPGIEFHFSNTRVSPYMGMVPFYINKKTRFEGTTVYHNGDAFTRTTTLKVDGGTCEQELITGTYPSYRDTYEQDRAYKSYGVSIPLGLDIYLYRNFFIGFELGFGFSKTKYKTIYVKEGTTYTNDYSAPSVKDTEVPAKTDSKFGFFHNNALRVGIWF